MHVNRRLWQPWSAVVFASVLCACDAVVDELAVDAGRGEAASLGADHDAALGSPCESTSHGPSMACYPANPATLNVGPCRAGTVTCVGGVTTCQGAVVPTAETCNGVDDNCDGVIDDIEPPIDAGLTSFEGQTVNCATGQQGICNNGVYKCTDAGPACVSLFPPTGRPEACDGLDDNCNGQIDDVGALGECDLGNSTLLGECKVGAWTCGDAGLTCVSDYNPVAETCNGLDDNCNGLVDEGDLCPGGTCAGAQGCQYSTCPYVLAYDGATFTHETTVGGAGLIGQKKQLTAGKKVDFEPMWARLDHASVDAGVVRTKLIAAEDEIVYFDQANLTIVEHLPGYEVLSSSSLQWGNLERPDPKELYALRSAALKPAISARWLGTVDVTSALATLDDRAVAQDVHKENFYELDFGPVHKPATARLVIDGWKHKLVRHLDDGVPIDRPHLDVQELDGSWTRALPLSTPRGDKKAVVFDLSSVHWPAGRYRMRIYTGTNEAGTAMWYLDRARLTEEALGPLTAREVPLSSAELAFEGAPTVIDPDDSTHPLRVRDDGKGVLSPEERTYGRFTRYGDVRELLAAPDDHMVVMRRGDAVTMRFLGIGPPAKGHVRTLFLRTELLFKQRSVVGSDGPTTLTRNVDPMPFHGMGIYPPKTGAFEADEKRRTYLLDYNTRVYQEGDVRWGP